MSIVSPGNEALVGLYCRVSGCGAARGMLQRVFLIFPPVSEGEGYKLCQASFYVADRRNVTLDDEYTMVEDLGSVPNVIRAMHRGDGAPFCFYLAPGEQGKNSFAWVCCDPGDLTDETLATADSRRVEAFRATV